MNEVSVYLKLISGFVCGIITFIWGGADAMFTILLSLMAIDYITGVMAGAKQKALSSEVGFYGLLKKCGILCVTALGHFIGKSSSMPEIRSLVIGFYIANEGISILENAGKIGVPLPKKLIEVLEQVKGD